MGMQVKLFENGVKAVLMPKGKGRQLMQIFNKENCMIAQREIKSDVFKDGTRRLEKLTLRKNKCEEGMIEHLTINSSLTPSSKYGWASRRTVQPEYSDSVFINDNWSGLGDKGLYYFQEKGNSALNTLPLLSKTNQTKTKLDEIRETFDAMFCQWYNPRTGLFRTKPMMPKSIQEQIANA